MALLRMSHVARRFGTTVALADVSLEVAAGEVHALVGENGAGKSTLMKILAGAESADAGTVEFGGRPFAPRRPADALAAGIAMIYQEFNLAPHLSVEANLLLGRERRVGGLALAAPLGASDERARCRAVLARLDLRVPLSARTGALGVADQQMLEVARALLSGARLIIMDEPTSALAAHEAQRLFAIVRQLRADGVSVVYISHFLEELEQVADRLTVIRDGRTVATGTIAPLGWAPPADRAIPLDPPAASDPQLPAPFTRAAIIRAMVGRDVAEMYPRVPHAIGGPLLEVRDLRGRRLPARASFALHRGEILGIAGLVGAGRTETLRALFGLDPAAGGSATLHAGAAGAAPVTVEGFAPGDWNRRGVGLLSEDRKAEGLAQNLSCLANVVLPALGRSARLGVVRTGPQRREAAALAGSLAIRWPSLDHPVSSLSGGNQQKVALARLLYSRADVLLLDEPTRGIDVGAKVDLYRAIGALAAGGRGVVMVSSYLPELLGVCDRIAVMSRGVLSAAYPVAELTPERVMHLAVGDAPGSP